jgi:hypothetical protein
LAISLSKYCQPLPFNPGRIVLGPGYAMEEAGLLLPSHKNGLVIADINKPTHLRFLNCTVQVHSGVSRTRETSFGIFSEFSRSECSPDIFSLIRSSYHRSSSFATLRCDLNDI